MAKKTTERGIGRPSRRNYLPVDPIPLRADPNATRRQETDAERLQGNRDWRAEFLFDINTLEEAPTCCDVCRAAWIETGTAPTHTPA